MDSEEKKLFDLNKYQELGYGTHYNDKRVVEWWFSFISNLLSLHDKKLAEKIRNMPFTEDVKTAKIVRKVLDLAAQIIEGKEGV